MSDNPQNLLLFFKGVRACNEVSVYKKVRKYIKDTWLIKHEVKDAVGSKK